MTPSSFLKATFKKKFGGKFAFFINQNCISGPPSHMYATRSQTEDATKLEYTAYNAQPTQHLSQPQGFLTEGDPLRDFGGHAKEESTLFSVTSQPPQHPQQPQQSSQQ